MPRWDGMPLWRCLFACIFKIACSLNVVVAFGINIIYRVGYVFVYVALKEDQRESTETNGCAGYAVAAETSKKAPQAVIKGFEPSLILSTNRP